MPDTPQDSAPPPSPAIADLAPAAADKPLSGLVSSLTSLARRKVAEDTRITKESDDQQARDRAVRNHAFQMEGVAASEIPKPWDADKEHKKFESNPIEGFGSAGGLFAMVASAFTKAPMENAIKGMAGAINSIKDGNEKAYERAYDAFKTNVKLADQRFKTQHELYSDALALGNADAAASAAKLHNAAVRFGDSQMLMLAEHGMIKEVYELQQARASAHEQMMKAAEATDLHTVQKAAIDAIKKNPPSTGDPVQDKMMLAAQVHNVYSGTTGKYGTAENEAVGRVMQQSVRENWPAQKTVDALADVHQQFSAKSQNIGGYQNAKANWAEQHPGETMSAEEDAKLLQQFGLSPQARGGAGGTGTSSQALKSRAVQEIVDKHKAEGKPISIAEAEHEYNLTRSTPSGNRVDDLQGKIDQTDNILTGIDKQLDTLNRIKGVSGLAGKIMRGEEIVGNIAGTTDTDRVQFRRRVHELQEIVPRILTDSTGRPLKSAQDKVDDIVAGLNAGDTGPNTIRAYEELREEIKKRQGDYKNRKGGTSATPGAAQPADTGSTDWLNAYPVKQ